MPVNLIDGEDSFSLSLLFSPNLKHYIDIDIKNDAYCIKHVDSDDPIYTIPKDFLLLPKDETKLIMQTKFIAWESDHKLKFLDIDANPPIEKIIEVQLHREHLNEN